MILGSPYKNIPVLINSYPRSGSVFFIESLYTNKNFYFNFTATSIHLPQIIGIDEAITVSIVRNPIDCISSNLYKGLFFNEKEILNNLESQIKKESEIFLIYLNQIINKKPYVIDFNSLIQDVQQEVKVFLENIGIPSLKQETKESHEIINILKKSSKSNNHSLKYEQHFPRGIHLDDQYQNIKKSVYNNDACKEAESIYLTFISNLKK